MIQALDPFRVLGVPSKAILHAGVEGRARKAGLNQLDQNASIQTDGILLRHALNQGLDQFAKGEEERIPVVNGVKMSCVPWELLYNTKYVSLV